MIRGRADSGDGSIETEADFDGHDEVSLNEDSNRPTGQSTLQKLMNMDLHPCERYTRWIVIGFNIIIMVFSFILIGVGSAALNGNYKALTGTTIASGIIVMGVFFLLISLLGMGSAYKQHRPTLAVYFVILLLLCFITLLVGIGVYVKKDSAGHYIRQAWMDIYNGNKQSDVLIDLQNVYKCCGLEALRDDFTPQDKTGDRICPDISGRPCAPIIENSFYKNLYNAGATGIAFAILMAFMAFLIVLLFRGIGRKQKTEEAANLALNTTEDTNV